MVTISYRSVSKIRLNADSTYYVNSNDAANRSRNNLEHIPVFSSPEIVVLYLVELVYLCPLCYCPIPEKGTHMCDVCDKSFVYKPRLAVHELVFFLHMI